VFLKGRKMPVRPALLSFLLLLSSASAIVAQTAGKARIVDYPRNGVQLGTGWRSASNDKTASQCVSFATAQDTAQEKALEIWSISDKSALMDELKVSAELRVKAIAFSGSAKTDFVKKVDVKEEYSNFSVHAIVANGAKYAVPSANGAIDLLPQFSKLAKSDPAAFLSQCGDSYVSAVFGGAELSGVLIFRTSSLDAKEKLKGSVEGSGWGLTASAEASSEISRYSQKNELKIFYHQSGGSGDPLPTNQDGLNKAIQELPKAAATAPQFYQIEIARYDSLPSWPRETTDWAETTYGEVASQYEKFSSLHEQVVSMLEHPESFILNRGVTQESLKSLDDKLLAHLQRLNRTAAECNRSLGASCSVDAADKISDYEYRILLPAAKESFADDIELTKAIDNLESKKTALRTDRNTAENSMEELLKKISSIGNVSLLREQARKQRDEFFAPRQQEINQAQAYVSMLRTTYPGALREAIAKQWINSAARNRCRENVLSSGCIDNSKMDAFKARIVIN